MDDKDIQEKMELFGDSIRSLNNIMAMAFGALRRHPVDDYAMLINTLKTKCEASDDPKILELVDQFDFFEKLVSHSIIIKNELEKLAQGAVAQGLKEASPENRALYERAQDVINREKENKVLN